MGYSRQWQNSFETYSKNKGKNGFLEHQNPFLPPGTLNTSYLKIKMGFWPLFPLETIFLSTGVLKKEVIAFLPF
ncbi:TPA: hypothetical protein HA338_18240 [Methanosarcina acetivorans]|nr:hypothetical protein [Methanosarcina acetivorans]HIH95854.1 hypothetical protein [Methanosarcina acetivorans]